MFLRLGEKLIVYSMSIINIFASTNNIKLSQTASFLQKISVNKRD